MACSVSAEACHTALPALPTGVPGHGGYWSGTAGPQITQSLSRQEDCPGKRGWVGGCRNNVYTH